MYIIYVQTPLQNVISVLSHLLLRVIWLMQITYSEVVAHEAVYKGINHAVSIGKPMAHEV